jgi:hypothetical protein
MTVIADISNIRSGNQLLPFYKHTLLFSSVNARMSMSRPVKVAGASLLLPSSSRPSSPVSEAGKEEKPKSSIKIGDKEINFGEHRNLYLQNLQVPLPSYAMDRLGPSK